jgi:hypothetical protein
MIFRRVLAQPETDDNSVARPGQESPALVDLHQPIPFGGSQLTDFTSVSSVAGKMLHARWGLVLR